MDAGRFDLALAWNDRASAVEPTDTTYALQGARLATLMGNHVAAFERLEVLLRDAPQSDVAWSEFAAAALRCNRRAEATLHCVHAFDADPTRKYVLGALLQLVPDELDGARAVGSAPDQRRCLQR
jgi:Flp pilus assembly protein TadD